MSAEIDKTKNIYGFLWTKGAAIKPPQKYHFNNMQDVIPERIVRGTWGIDAGSGCGYDTYIMARDNPSVKIVSIDISDGVYTNLRLNRNLQNVYVVKGSVLNMPFKEKVFDFAYSFGVLHLTPVPQKGITELFRILRERSPVFLYLYEDHSENIIKYVFIKAVSFLRRITIKIPPKTLYILSSMISPLIFILFSFSSKILMKFESTRRIAKNMPFNFGTSLFSLRGDLYDRFGAPIEYRFNKKEIYGMLNKNHFLNINVTRLQATAGWVVWGYKNA